MKKDTLKEIQANLEKLTILGVTRSSSTEDIKRAFRSLALVHHPDKGGSEELFKQISEAYAWMNKHHIQQAPAPDRNEVMRKFNERQTAYQREEAERAKTRSDRVVHTNTVDPNEQYHFNARVHYDFGQHMTTDQKRQAARDILKQKGINL